MARMIAAFGTSHSTMLFSARENWEALFDHVDRKAPIHDFDGEPRTFDDLLRTRPADADQRIAKEVIGERFRQTAEAMDRLHKEIQAASLDALIVIGDDQREIFKDASRPAIGLYFGETIRNAASPSTPTDDWYTRDQRRRLEDREDHFYPCHATLGAYLIEGLTASDFDVTAVKELVGEQFEGHAYSFVHRRYLVDKMVPIVPVFLNTYYPPNQPSPERCFALGAAIGKLVEAFPQDMRVGIVASGGLSHFLVNEKLDSMVVDAIRNSDLDVLRALPAKSLQSGSSEIRNWICVAAAARHLKLEWISYIPAYRSRALTGVGLCFAKWS
jgi:Catalytic LigB subunit of aromatic ring-opening dioxygenase